MTPPDHIERFTLGSEEIAERLGIALSTLNAWLRADQLRPEESQVFAFHRWRGRSRFWSELSFQKFELAIHRESQFGVLCSRRGAAVLSESDPDAADALAVVLNNKPPAAF